MKRRYVIIAATFEVAREARATAERLATVDPDVPRTLVVVDADPRTTELLSPVGEVVTGEQLGITLDEVGRWAGAYGSEGVHWVAFPHVLAAIGEPGEAIMWLSSAIELVAPPEPLWDALEHSEFVAADAAPSLAPHDHERPDTSSGRPHALQPVTSVVSHGGELVARSVLGWRAGSEVAAACWAQWPVPREHPTHEHLASGRVAQQWFNALAMAPGVKIVGDAGIVLSIAQLLAREVTQGPDPSAPLIDGNPLRMLLLRDFDPERPHLLEGEVKTARVSDQPALAPVLRGRAQALLNAGWVLRSDGPPPSTRWAMLAHGLPVSPVICDLVRAGQRARAITSSPFTEPGASQLLEYACQPARQGGSIGVNRLLGAFYAHRADLQVAYPALDGPDGLGFLGWAWIYGREELGIPEAYLPPRPAFLDAAPSEAEVQRGPDTEGVNLAGYFTSELGLGESARQIAAALTAASVPTTPVQGLLVPPTRQEAEFQPVGPKEAHHDVNIVVVNGDQMPHFARDVGPGFFEGRPTVGVWWWEVDPFPAEEWSEALNWLDEIWVGTDFIRDLVAPHVDVPVWVFPVPVSVTRATDPLPRSHFGFEEDETVFLYVWDYHSTEARKNPSGLVEAYRKAFPDPAASKTRLVLKCINHQNLPEADEKVRLAAAGRDDIVFIDRFLSAREKNGLLEVCDCYVSPHRSEGFGYTPAEAMLLGKPVIVTGYGGTTQYTDDSVARLIAWEAAKVGPDALPYPPHGVWADPDVDDLADALRWMVQEPEKAAAMAERGRKRVEQNHAIEVSGAAMAERVAELRARKAAEARLGAGSGPVPPSSRPRGGTSRLARVVRRAATVVPLLGRARRGWWRIQDRAVSARTADVRAEVGRLAGASESARDDRRHLRERIVELERRASTADTTVASQVQELQSAVASVASSIDGVARNVSRVERDLTAAQSALTERVDDHTRRHSPEVFGPREAGLALHDVDGLGRAFGGSDLHATGDAYADFLALFRGPYERVLDLMAGYEPLLRGHGPLLDLGCGRGEVLEIARRAGIQARGVDLDRELIEDARRRGHDTEVAEALETLRTQQDASLGAITSIHVIEHLPTESLRDLFVEALRVLRPGGLFLAETINPHEVSAAATFWVDPTHRGPVFPEVALALALTSGFSRAHVYAPDGQGDWEHDRVRSTRYALVARR